MQLAVYRESENGTQNTQGVVVTVSPWGLQGPQRFARTWYLLAFFASCSRWGGLGRGHPSRLHRCPSASEIPLRHTYAALLRVKLKAGSESWMRWRQQWPRLAARRMDSPSHTPVPSLLPNTSSQPGHSVLTQRLGQGQAVGGGSPELGVGVGAVPTGHLHDTALPSPGRPRATCEGLSVQGLTAPGPRCPRARAGLGTWASGALG